MDANWRNGTSLMLVCNQVKRQSVQVLLRTTPTDARNWSQYVPFRFGESPVRPMQDNWHTMGSNGAPAPQFTLQSKQRIHIRNDRGVIAPLAARELHVVWARNRAGERYIQQFWMS